MRVEPGAPIVLVPDVPALWHLPADTGDDAALCGLTGDLFVYSAAMRDRRACGICLQRGPADHTIPGTDPLPERRIRTGGRRPQPPRISDAQTRALWHLHHEQSVPLNEIGRRYHHTFGYSSHSAMANALSARIRQLGLPTRDRIEMTVAATTKHGLARRTRPKNGGKHGNGSKSLGYKRWLLNQRAGHETRQPLCAATTAKGTPCKRPALVGADFCQAHDPARKQQRDATLAAMRARSPLQNIEYVEWEPIRQQLLNAHARLGDWDAIAARLGLTRSSVRTYAFARDMRISRQRAGRFARAIASLTVDQERAA